MVHVDLIIKFFDVSSPTTLSYTFRTFNATHLDDLRVLQRNISRSHLEQIAFLREKQKELLETHRLEVTSFQETMNLHTAINDQTKTILSQASALRDYLSMLFEDMSRMSRRSEQEAMQQGVAISHLQEVNGQLITEYHTSIEETLSSISQAMRSWHKSLESGLSRAETLDRINKDLMARVQESNDGLDDMKGQLNTVRNSLDQIARVAKDNTRTLLDIQEVGSHKINAAINASITNVTEALCQLETNSQIARDEVISVFDSVRVNMRDKVARTLEETTFDIRNMAATSQEKIEQLNMLVDEFRSKQEDVLWQLGVIHRAWRFMSAIISMVSIAVFVGCERLLTPVSYKWVLLSVICTKVCIKGSLYCWRSMPSQHIREKCLAKEQKHNLAYLLDSEFNIWRKEENYSSGQYGPPPYYSQCDTRMQVLMQPGWSQIYRGETRLSYDYNSPTHELCDLTGSINEEHCPYMGEAFGLSLGLYTCGQD
ncbi:hypothetical protein BCR41DRAFT_370827 [Lobosporangium transversale]|uniref:Uncharacterized protein n=1 Tax=Lobosporangium transversale TaxID=64571 RepID=A0A1Y2GM82_9FUNG|nr:hypothetical protein BCR41DRAFT_370827 [Lobosporangium transversale]ORZ15468.1 hypothetical protein BCR41DRAFT_370827 [Lobosporangium transversale]|eukprot:XP_021881216.1 hypothetical protein BCR41DRAFT_370827 [Lobosporangium transversale]